MPSILELVFTNPIVAFILLVGVVVFVHETGHYLAGRMVGVDVEEYSLGFGPKAVGFKRGLTEFKICWLPLGGYVRFYGSEIGAEIPAERRHRALLTSKVYKRATISIAGPLANFILSFGVMVALSSWGMPQPAPVVSVVPGSPAERGGLRDGDTVVGIDGKPVSTWADLNAVVSSHAGTPLAFEVRRDERSETVIVTPSAEESQSAFGDKIRVGRIGVAQFLVAPRIAVAEGSFAHAVGLRSGDRVVALDGRPVTFGYEALAALEAAASGAPGAPRSAEVLRPTQSNESASALVEAIATGGRGPGGRSATGANGAKDGDVPSTPLTFTLTSVRRADDPAALPVASPTELTLVDPDAIPRGDARQASLDAWKACGLQAGDTLVRFGSAERLANPVQVGSVLETLARGLEAFPHDARPAPVPVSVTAFGWNGPVRSFECVLTPRLAKDSLGRARWTLDFPYRFLGRGVPVPPVVVRSEGVMDALADGGRAVVEQAGTIFTGLRKLVTGSLPLSNLGGPIAIARVAGDAAEGGALLFLLTVSWMSINIGMFNLLPLPALDGGSLLLHGVEAAYGRALPIHVQALVQRAGVVLILLLFVLVFYNDILRLFTTP